MNVIPAELQGRISPHARELEEAVLGAMMLERDKIQEVSDVLTEKHFYAPENKIIFNAIMHLGRAGNIAVDLLTVHNYLKSTNELELIGGSYYLAQLTNRVSSAANIAYHSRILTQKMVQRELIRVSGEIASDAFDDSQDSFVLLDDSERKLFEIKNIGLKRSYQSISDLVSKSITQLEERSNKETDGITGVASGFSDLDRITSGWQPSDLIILAARPAMGKTAFALSLARNAAVDFKKSVMIFSLEMADVQLVNRLISAEAQIPADKIRKSNLDDEEWLRLHDKTVALSESKIFIDDSPQLNILDLTAKCRRVHSAQEHGLDLIVVDYLQLLRHETKGQGNREQEIAYISRSLKGLAKELSVPIIALAQLSREVEKRNNKRPQLADLRESGSIEQDADMVLFLYRDEYYARTGQETENKGADNPLYMGVEGLCEIIIGKNRHGAVGRAYSKFQSAYSRFVDLEPEDRIIIRSFDKDYESHEANNAPVVHTLQSKMNTDQPLDDDFGPGGSYWSGNNFGSSGSSAEITEEF